MSYAARAALVRATVKHGVGYLPVEQVASYLPNMSLEALLADLGGLHDHGEVTLIGDGKAAKVRFDQLIILAPDGGRYFVQDRATRRGQSQLGTILIPDMEAVPCE